MNELKQLRPGVSHAALVEAATDALYGLVNEDVSEQLAYGGDYDYPSFVKFTVPLPEGGAIEGIDQTTEFSFEESPSRRMCWWEPPRPSSHSKEASIGRLV